MEILPFVSLTNSKPSASGFEFEEEKSDGKGVNQPERKLGMIYGICHSTSTTGQANKSARGMPWHQEPMKDVISCDKLRGAANER